jgi:hypothetical protein
LKKSETLPVIDQNQYLSDTSSESFKKYELRLRKQRKRKPSPKHYEESQEEPKPQEAEVKLQVSQVIADDDDELTKFNLKLPDVALSKSETVSEIQEQSIIERGEINERDELSSNDSSIS